MLLESMLSVTVPVLNLSSFMIFVLNLGCYLEIIINLVASAGACDTTACSVITEIEAGDHAGD